MLIKTIAPRNIRFNRSVCLWANRQNKLVVFIFIQQPLNITIHRNFYLQIKYFLVPSIMRQVSNFIVFQRGVYKLKASICLGFTPHLLSYKERKPATHTKCFGMARIQHISPFETIYLKKFSQKKAYGKRNISTFINLKF